MSWNNKEDSITIFWAVTSHSPADI